MNGTARATHSGMAKPDISHVAASAPVVQSEAKPSAEAPDTAAAARVAELERQLQDLKARAESAETKASEAQSESARIAAESARAIREAEQAKRDRETAMQRADSLRIQRDEAEKELEARGAEYVRSDTGVATAITSSPLPHELPADHPYYQPKAD